MAQLTRDLRYSLRWLRKSPAFAAAAVATLALGIGANTAVFSLVRAVLLHDPAFPEPGRIVLLWEKNPQQGYEANPPSAPDFDDWKRESRGFDALALVDAQRQFNLSESGRPERVPGAAVGADLFRVLGVAPYVGRVFAPEEEAPGRDRVVLLSDGLWERRFHRSPSILGSEIAVNGRPSTVVGVMPAGFAFPGDSGSIGGGAPPPAAELWVPLALTPAQRSQRSAHALRAVGRLRRGVSPEAAARELSAVQSRIGREHPTDYVGSEVSAIPLETQAVGSVRGALWILLGAVAFVLLIACANIAHLLLARAASRRKEMAIRTALGAGRRSILAQLAVESLCLSFAGAAGGLLLAVWVIAALRGFLPAELPHAAAIHVDWPVLAFTLAVSVGSAALFGFAPAIELARTDLAGRLAGGRGAEEGHGGGRLRDALVVGQIAVALLLSVGAGLLGRTLLRLEGVAPGFDARSVLTAEITLPDEPYETRADRARFFHSLVDRLDAIPGVASAAITTQLPLSGENMNFALEVAGRPAAPNEFPSADVRAVSPRYFEALRIPLRAGRTFQRSDGADSPRVLVINESLARRYFPGTDAIGRRLTLGINGFDGTVVGVVGDVKQVALELPANEEVYMLYEQAPFWPTARVLVRTAGDPRALAPVLRDSVRALDRSQAVAAVRPLTEVNARSTSQPRFRAALVGFFGILAVVLAAIGLSGVLSYSVSRRSREIGIRMALGARTGQVVGLVLGRGLGLAAAGLAAGVLASLALTRVLSGFLFGVGPTDAATLAGAAAFLACVAVAACGVPARRAARVDPNQALRSE